MRARMHAGTRIVSETPRTLYPGDIVEGALAREQVALGNAEEIKEEAPAESEGKPKS